MPSPNEERVYGQPSTKAPYGPQKIVSYTSQEEPAKNLKLWQLIMKLDGYGVADQKKRVLLLTDQDNRAFALRYLAQHLDLLHLLDLVQSLTKLIWVKIAEHGRGHFDGFEWPWQWGPEPEKEALVPLPRLFETYQEPEEDQAEKLWRRVRAEMLLHEVFSSELGLVTCTCLREFESDDNEDEWFKYKKHLRARVKEVIIPSDAGT